MKTQIKELRNGSKHQLLNPDVEYPRDGNIGTNKNLCKEIFNKIREENPNEIILNILGKEFKLFASYSTTNNFNGYHAILEHDDVRLFGLEPKKNNKGIINFYNAGDLYITNGGNSLLYICPSLINIK